jgi:hypothetical protein
LTFILSIVLLPSSYLILGILQELDPLLNQRYRLEHRDEEFHLLEYCDRDRVTLNLKTRSEPELGPTRSLRTKKIFACNTSTSTITANMRPTTHI